MSITATAQPGFTLITASNIMDLHGVPLAAGTIVFTPVTDKALPVGFRIGGASAGQAITRSYAFPVVNGAIVADGTFVPGTSTPIAPQLPDTTLTFPVNICYSVRILDANTNLNLLGPGYDSFQPSGATFSFDAHTPNQAAMLTVQTGPAGTNGAAGAQGAATVVTANGANGDFAVSNHLTAKVIQGELMAKAYDSTGTAGDGLANAIVAGGAGATIQLDPTYSVYQYQPEFDSFNAPFIRTRRYLPGQVIKDNRPGKNTTLSYSVPTTSAPGANSTVYQYMENPDPLGRGFSSNRTDSMLLSAPGSHAYGSESGGMNHTDYVLINSKGISGNRNSSMEKYGTGDFQGTYQEMTTGLGAINGDDEGVSNATYINQMSATPWGQVKQAPDFMGPVQFLRLTNGHSLQTVGGGRYMLLMRNYTSGPFDYNPGGAMSGVTTDAAVASITMTAQTIHECFNAVTVASPVSGSFLSAVVAYGTDLRVRFNLDAAQAIGAVAIPAGANATGAWQANHLYSLNDTYTTGAMVSIVNTPYLSGGTYGDIDYNSTSFAPITVTLNSRPRGAWAGNTKYYYGDSYPQGGVTYYVNTNYQAYGTFGAQDAPNIQTFPIGFRGPWAAGVIYHLRESYSNAGATVYVKAEYTSGVSFGALDTTNTQSTPIGIVAGVAAFSGTRRNERVLITGVGTPTYNSANAAWSQTISLKIRQCPDGTSGLDNNSWVGGINGTGTGNFVLLQDLNGAAVGFAQSVARVAGFDKGIGVNTLAYPLLGALDVYTVVTGTNSLTGQTGLPGFSELLPVTSHGTFVRNASNVVTFTPDGGGFNDTSPGYAFSVVALDSTFNVVNATLNNYNNVTGPYNYTYNKSGAAATTTGNVIQKLGSNVCAVYRGVEVIRTCDPTTSSEKVGDNVGLEFNNISWGVGAVVESPSHYSGHVAGENLGVNVNTPLLSSSGKSVLISGPVADFTPFIITNANDSSLYRGLGGNWTIPKCILIAGVFNTIFDMAQVTNNNPILFRLPTYESSKESLWGYQQAQIMQGSTRSAGFNMNLNMSGNEFAIRLGNLYFGMKYDPVTPAYTQIVLGNPVEMLNHQIMHLADGVNANDAVAVHQVPALALVGGLSVTIATAKLTTGGVSGSMTFTSGLLTASTLAT